MGDGGSRQGNGGVEGEGHRATMMEVRGRRGRSETEGRAHIAEVPDGVVDNESQELPGTTAVVPGLRVLDPEEPGD